MDKGREMRVKPRPSNPWLAATKITTAKPETLTYAEAGFRGMDARTASDRLAPGFVQSIVNGFPDGKGGIVGRAGFQGLFTTPLGDPIWNPITFYGDGTPYIIFASGGKLYSTTVDSATYDEIQIGGTTSFAFADDGEHVRMAIYGKYLYGIEGGASGRVFTVDTSSGAVFVAQYVDVLPEIQTYSSALYLHPTDTCQLEGTYEWRVRPIKSSTAAYPPTGTSPTVGQAVNFDAEFIVQPSTATVRGNKINAVGLYFDDPSPATNVTHYMIERRGGTLGTVDWRLVAIVEKAVDSNVGSLATASTVSGYVWNAHVIGTSNVFYDFRVEDDLKSPDPDSGDYEGLTINLGEYPPVGAADIAVHGGRIWLAVQNTLYPSWILEYEPDATTYGLTWTTVPDENDPGYLSKGASFTIGGADDPDSIVCLSQSQAESDAGDYGALLIAFRQNSHTFVSGDTPATWRAEPSRVGEFYGCLSPRAVANVDGQWVYQSPRGTQRMVTNSAPRYLGEIDGQFPLETILSQSAIISTTGYRRIAFAYYDRKLWVFAPEADTAEPFPVFAWNSRTDGWAQIFNGGGFGFTAAVVTSGQNDIGAFYLAGFDGQLYKYTGTVDKATPASGGTAYDLTVVTAAHGGAVNGRPMFSAARPVQLMADVKTDSTATLTWIITSDANVTTSGTYSLTAGRNALDFTTISDVRGLTHKVTLSLPATATTRIAAYSLTCVEQSTKR